MSNAPTREVARRVFADEFNDASHTFKESDDERAPVYLLLPTGERANRVFAVGTLTETEDVGEDSEYWRGRVVDPTGTFYVYAGQYQPDPASVLRDAEPPLYVSVVGKPRTYETDEGEVNVSVRPESITPVDAATRDRWVVETAERTLERVKHFEAAAGEADAEEGPADAYVRMAQEEYDLPLSRYRDAVVSALESLDEEADLDGGETDTESGPEMESDGGTAADGRDESLIGEAKEQAASQQRDPAIDPDLREGERNLNDELNPHD